MPSHAVLLRLPIAPVVFCQIGRLLNPRVLTAFFEQTLVELVGGKLSLFGLHRRSVATTSTSYVPYR
jgi:hypothetical protein